MNKKILAAVWLVAWVHVIFFSPPADSAAIAEFILAVMQSNTELIDPFVFMVFNLLGIWPLVMVAMLVQDTQGKWKAWPFAISAMVLGNSALYIYLFIRKEQKEFAGPKTRLIRVAESKVVAVFLLAATIALFAYGLLQGSVSELIAVAQVNFFADAMMVDSILFPIAFAFILADDMRRRNMPINGFFWLYALVPVLGATTYLLVRAPLPDASSEGELAENWG